MAPRRRSESSHACHFGVNGRTIIFGHSSHRANVPTKGKCSTC